ncbi:antibiotic biosynthesis monooxygenase [Siculibacillus lacustris]|uniref:Antibiotic biosynthesis monooxygenase n=1 Tax=Siculibacillus lacustris TaxID=1549641 RepID=A0A4Q9VXG2_9HYPH|nr:antibiotic biosynthesis monooxygenase [Siculibacillus lacustris]TBW41172.1 antibiotic biosynthesis monooxygenase [Siculibacillus lacustris]
MLHVVAIITTKPGLRAQVLDLFRALVPTVRAEAGCIEYGPTVDAGVPGLATFGPDTFVVIEKWESAAHLAAHAAAPHMAAYGAATADMIAARAVHALNPA